MSDNLEKFNEFYKLKSIYENQINKDKMKIMKNPTLSWKEKRSEFRKLKPQCIKCKRPVGNIFSIKVDKETKDRYLKASCGDLVEPCDFFIEMVVPETKLYNENIEMFEKDIIRLKNDVIDAKNKLLFGYITSETAVENFDKLKDIISDTSTILEYYIDKYTNIINNPAKIQMINTLKMDINNTFVTNIKMCIDNFNKTNDEQYIKDAVDIYVNFLQPKIKELRESQYSKASVEYNIQTGTYHLIQKQYLTEDVEDLFDITINDKKTQTKDQTKEPGVKSKAKKLIIENDNEYNISNGRVKWNNNDYQTTWDNLSNKHKEVLMNDQEWMLKTMDTLVDNMRNKKSRLFVPPNNLKFPPVELQDDTYDFGNNFYNEIFNNLPTFKKNTLLTLYSDKNGVLDYSLMEDAVNNEVASQLGFRNINVADLKILY